MYPYHNQIKKRIRNGELTGYRFVVDYPRIGECLVLEFCTLPKTRPVRPCKYHEYLHLLEQWNDGRFKK